MKSPISLAPVSHLKELNNLFIEMTEKNCNLRCKHCYIKFPISKNVKDFIPIDLVKKALAETVNRHINCIYLTGAEPMTHPDFNSILRLCLKRSNVCIFTNGSCINEKKARFLKRVEDESNFEIIFKLSIDHYNEIKSDDLRGRGTYRQTLHAIKCLNKYDFNPILNITNYYKEDPETILQEFKNIYAKMGFDAGNNNFVINEYFEGSSSYETTDADWESLDCEYGRILTTKGVYSCPFLANDHRGRCGSNFLDFSDKTLLESPFCHTCIKNKKAMFSIDFSKFES